MMFKKDTTQFGSIYRGKVLDNIDPDKLGRLKIQIFGVFDDIEVADLPWAVPAMPLSVGAGTGFGYFAVPEIGSYVWCFFEGEDLYQPVYFAEAPDKVHGLPSERTTDYPDTRVLKTKNGIIISIDDKSGSQEIKIVHPGGAAIRIDNGGNVIVTGTTVSINP